MPKASVLQADFSGGEFGPLVSGRADVPIYKTGMEKCFNYIPTLEGPLVRRPGTKHIVLGKDPSKPPTFVPFSFSNTQNYVLEFGDYYLRFYANQGLVVTSGTSYVVTGNVDLTDGSIFSGDPAGLAMYPFWATRSDTIPLRDENLSSTSSVVNGSILEVPTPYSYDVISAAKIWQKEDTIFIACSSRPTHLLQRYSNTEWTLKRAVFKDGPYLPLNTYKDIGDKSHLSMIADNTFGIGSRTLMTASPASSILSIIDASSKPRVQTANAVNYKTGDRVFIIRATGSPCVNNSNINSTDNTWKITVVNSSTFDLEGLTFTGTYTGSGIVYPTILENVQKLEDHGRVIGVIPAGAGSTRFFGRISLNNLFQFDNPGNYFAGGIRLAGPTPASFYFIPEIESTSDLRGAFNNSSVVDFWHLGIWNSSLNGHATCGTFHQDRLVLSGTPYYPQQVDASETSNYFFFPPSKDKGLDVLDTNALQFTIVSDNYDPIKWIKSGYKGMLAGTGSNEFLISPSGDGQALTPTNINAEIVGDYGSSDVDAVRSGNAVIYLQNSQRKIRELNYFSNLSVHKSIPLNKLSDQITFPSISKLVNQKEFFPLIYGIRADGNFISMSYEREDQTLKSAFASHQLGGQSDSGGTNPLVKTMAVIPDPTGRFDQLWMAVQRYINGTTVLSIEVMSEPFNSKTDQRDAFYVDCGGTYDSSVVIAGITQSGSAWITASNHGFLNGDKVLVTDVVGLNSSVVDINGVIINSNLINDRVFVVGSASTNAFFPLNVANSSYIDSSTYSPYFSGGKVRKLVSTISGLTWLKNETVDVLADGGIHGRVQVNSAGVLALTYPAAVVQIGYAYKSSGKTLRPDAGSSRGSAIGMTRRPHRVAFNLQDVGDFAFGTSFDNLHQWDFGQADVQLADQAIPLYTGIIRDGVESEYDFDGQICFEQNSPLPGMIKSLTILMDEFDV